MPIAEILGPGLPRPLRIDSHPDPLLPGPIVLRQLSREELIQLANESGAVAQFTGRMGGPPDLAGADAGDLVEFLRENAP